MNNLVGLLSYMVAGKKVDQVNNVNLTLQYIRGLQACVRGRIRADFVADFSSEFVRV
jgi:hypothetical protein